MIFERNEQVDNLSYNQNFLVGSCKILIKWLLTISCT